ncbi:flagellar motor switch protein FliM [Bacillus sp. JJ1764]|uniref:flagellar motor switch protein FliM n=1 Tax=Bacillus sp. JJ1764 TaxID=3122964 RepID=UPI002FFEAA6F
MADVLSQQEIDALLLALNNGDLQASDVSEQNDKVKVYDFKRAMRYSKEQLRSITRIHENFTRVLTSYLSAQLRTFVQIEIDLVDQVTYSEFISSIPSKTILNVFDVNPMDGKMVLEANPQVAYAMIERLLGGQGDPTERDGSLTEIETALIQKIIARGFEVYDDSWENIENIHVKWDAIESNPQFLQISSPNETVIIIAFRTTIGEVSGRMTLCLPHMIIEPVLPKLSAQQWLTSKSKADDPQQDKIKQNLDAVHVPVIAELGSATLPVSEIMNLQVGDVVGIETGKIKLKIGKSTRFLGNPGVKKGHYAVQIDQLVQMEGDERLV